MPERKFTDEEIDLLFHALSDRTRRDIMDKVSQGEQSISGLSRQYEVSFAAIQKHVTVLERAGLISKRIEGRQKMVRNNPETLRQASELLSAYERIWCQRVDAIGQLLEQQKNDER